MKQKIVRLSKINILLIAVALAFTGCQKEEVVSPENQTAVSGPNLKTQSLNIKGNGVRILNASNTGTLKVGKVIMTRGSGAAYVYILFDPLTIKPRNLVDYSKGYANSNYEITSITPAGGATTKDIIIQYKNASNVWVTR